MVPSIGALQWHWKRSCYVIRIWKQAASNTMSYPPLQENGWKLEGDNLLIDWDSNEHMARIRSRVALIRKGCGCKTGCTTNRCKCKKGNVYCGPGCTCDNCNNHPIQQTSFPISEIEREETSSSQDLRQQVDNIMSSVFGTLDESDDEMDESGDEFDESVEEMDEQDDMDIF